MMLANKIPTWRTQLIYCLFAAGVLFSFSADAAKRIGLIKTYEPTATVIRNGAEIKLDIGAEIFQGDTIKTDAHGSVGIMFTDGGVLTLGPSGKINIEKFLFKPDEQKVAFSSRIEKGSVAFISGAIGRISPDSVQFIAPTATLHLHGTKILVNVD